MKPSDLVLQDIIKTHFEAKGKPYNVIGGHQFLAIPGGNRTKGEYLLTLDGGICKGDLIDWFHGGTTEEASLHPIKQVSEVTWDDDVSIVYITNYRRPSA